MTTREKWMAIAVAAAAVSTAGAVSQWGVGLWRQRQIRASQAWERTERKLFTLGMVMNQVYLNSESPLTIEVLAADHRFRQAMEEAGTSITSVKDLHDGWDRPYRYRRNGKGWRIYSAGVNGVDENGRGDDIEVEGRSGP